MKGWLFTRLLDVRKSQGIFFHRLGSYYLNLVSGYSEQFLMISKILPTNNDYQRLILYVTVQFSLGSFSFTLVHGSVL